MSWKDIWKIQKVIMSASNPQRKQPWDRMKGKIIPKDPNRPRTITTKAKDLIWAYTIRNDMKLKLKNKVQLPVQIGRAWSLTPIREGDYVSVWGYWRKGYFRGIWVHKAPRLNRWYIRFWCIFQHGLHSSILILSVFPLLYTVNLMGWINTKVVSYSLFVLYSNSLLWLMLLILTAIISILNISKKNIPR